jgi:hypothetical protein
MRRLMWPWLIVVLLGALVALHAVTLVVSLAGAGPRAMRPAEDPARPRAGWLVDVDAEPMSDGLLRVALRLADASVRPIVDAGVTVRLAKAEFALAHRGEGTYEAIVAGIETGARPCRVSVSRGGCGWTFDRVVRVRGSGEADR